MRSCGIYPCAVCKFTGNIQDIFLDMNLKSINLQLQPLLPGASVLNKLCPKEVTGSATHWFDLLTAIMENAARLSTGDVIESLWKRYICPDNPKTNTGRGRWITKSLGNKGERVDSRFICHTLQCTFFGCNDVLMSLLHAFLATEFFKIFVLVVIYDDS